MPDSINKMIFYKKIHLNHILKSEKSYINLGNYVIETEILIIENKNINQNSNKAFNKKENESYQSLFKEYTQNTKM
jgi:hypothetical protein